MSAPACPYIVRFKPRHSQACEDAAFNHHAATGGDLDCCCSAGHGSRWAYATLEEADRAVVLACEQRGYTHRDARAVSDAYEDRNHVKLPDGSEIVVEATDYNRLWDELTPDHEPELLAGVDLTIWIDGAVADDRWGAAILAAWNAEYGIPVQKEIS